VTEKDLIKDFIPKDLYFHINLIDVKLSPCYLECKLTPLTVDCIMNIAFEFWLLLNCLPWQLIVNK